MLAPKTGDEIGFDHLLVLPTLRGIVVGVYAGPMPAGMAIAGVAKCGHGASQSHVASRVGTSQDWEAMAQTAVYWLVLDSVVAAGALRTNPEGGHYGDGIQHLYAAVLVGSCVGPTSVINWITKLLH